jgi:outer membrane protein OmpA-like peptidoglycan-associated protein
MYAKIWILLLFWAQVAQAQLTVNIRVEANELIKEVLLGNNIQVSNIVYRGSHESKGQFTNTDTPLRISEGVILSTGDARNAIGPNKGDGFTGMMGSRGDRDLNSIAKGYTYDAAMLEMDILADFDMFNFKYVFASEEYEEYVNSRFNDVFAFFLVDLETQEISNLAITPHSKEPITINTINAQRNKDFYIPNPRGNTNHAHTLEFDGLSEVLTAFHPVIPGKKYRLKIVISDVGDDQLDSAVFLEAGTFSSLPQDTFYAQNKNYFKTFDQVGDTLASAMKSLDESKNTEKEVLKSEAPKTIPAASNRPIDTLSVYFEYDSYQITQREKQRIKQQYSYLQRNNFIDIILEGHTDTRGSDTYNQTLSEKRSEAVKAYLISLGAESKKWSIYSSGKTKPRAMGELEIDHAENRRVDVFLR